MVTAAGLLVGSWRRLATLDTGFQRAHVLLVTTNARAAQIPANQRRFAYARILERLGAIPGVDTASAAMRTPLGSVNWNGEITIDGAERAPDGEAVVQLNEVTPGYFATIGSRVVAGRDFTADDSPAAPMVAIVNEELARRFMGGRSPIGQRLRFTRGDRNVYEIVGLAANSKQSSLRELNEPVAYFPISQDPALAPSITFALRARESPASLTPSVRAAFAELDSRISLRIVTLEQQVGRALVLPRALGLLSGIFGALALLLAAIGLYGIIAYSVARRRNEIGVRIALGAAGSRVVRMILGDVGRIVGGGVVVGALLSLAATRLVVRFLYGVEPNDPSNLMLSALALAVVALAASAVPAWRAARLDPVAALRAD
jgi:predicted permease